ncbi:MAG: hypothetical protein GXN92_02010 [Candidatus Micrarchaeota archaeon]|nr:hypothetical protein [Candidatus Micrarchaeota archaeon]
MVEYVKVPKKRVKAIKDAQESIEKKLKVKLSFEDNNIRIDPGEEGDLYTATLYVQAMGRGFSPKEADLLLNPDYSLTVIDLQDHFNTKNRIHVMKGRIIGRKGSMKLELERATDSKISVYGNTVAIIAPFYGLPKLREALNMLLGGAKHSTVFNYLSKARQMINRDKLAGFKRL